MGSGIPLDEAAIVATVLEGILYGFSLLMFVSTVWLLTQERERHASYRTSLAITFILVILSTAHIVVNIVRSYEGLIKYRDMNGGPLAYFEDVAQTTFVVKNVVYALQTFLGDGMVIYRCYVVWQSIWVIMLPCLLWCSVVVTGVGSVYSVSQATTNSSGVFAKENGQWIASFYASTLATNLLSSGLLAYRIWAIERSAAPIRATKEGTMMPILRVMVDAAVLYSASLFTALICFVNSNNGQDVMADVIPPIISIAFYMVLIRVAMARQSKLYPPTSWGGPPTVQSRRTMPLQIHISQFSRDDSSSPHVPGSSKDYIELPSVQERELNGAASEV